MTRKAYEKMTKSAYEKYRSEETKKQLKVLNDAVADLLKDHKIEELVLMFGNIEALKADKVNTKHGKIDCLYDPDLESGEWRLKLWQDVAPKESTPPLKPSKKSKPSTKKVSQ